MMQKTVTSRGVEYVIELRSSQMFGKRACAVLLDGLDIYTYTYAWSEYIDDYIRIVKDAMKAYHGHAEAERLEREKEAEALRKFEEWDGDCRE